MSITGDKNTQINGNENQVKVNHITNDNRVYNQITNEKQNKTFEKVETLPFTVDVYRRKIVELDFAFIAVFILGSVFIEMNSLNINLAVVYFIVLLLIWHFLPQKFNSLFITVYSHALKIGDKEIEYKNIRSCQYVNNEFSYRLHDDDRNYTLTLYNTNHAEYIFYKIERYAIFYGTKSS